MSENNYCINEVEQKKKKTSKKVIKNILKLNILC